MVLNTQTIRIKCRSCRDPFWAPAHGSRTQAFCSIECRERGPLCRCGRAYIKGNGVRCATCRMEVKAAARQPLPNSLRFAVFERDQFTCQYCGWSAPQVKLEVDHVAPASKGGPDTLDNLLTACDLCNSGKRDKFLAAAAGLG